MNKRLAIIFAYLAAGAVISCAVAWILCLWLPEQASAQYTEDWQTKTPSATDLPPRYDFIVEREAQVWWPPRESSVGNAGRWGPRVTIDPKTRRSGMRCPPFALLFLDAIARL